MLPEGVMEKIGQRLRAKRLEAGLTQEQLQEISGIDQTSISAIEGGRSPNPRLSTILSLTYALGMDLNELVAGDNDVGEGSVRQPTRAEFRRLLRQMGFANEDMDLLETILHRIRPEVTFDCAMNARAAAGAIAEAC